MTCAHHWHRFHSRVWTTTYCCLCFEWEDRYRTDRPHPHFQNLELATESYQVPPGLIYAQFGKAGAQP